MYILKNSLNIFLKFPNFLIQMKLLDIFYMAYTLWQQSYAVKQKIEEIRIKNEKKKTNILEIQGALIF